MFRKVLIANRGEIACRIAATLREMGIASVAVYSEADRGALHARMADAAIEIGPAEPRESYLNIGALIGAAKQAGAEAIHPGYGFLAENADFAAAVEGADLVFVGPTPKQIGSLGDKRAARAIAERARVPIVPGAEGATASELAKAARRLGYPVLLKAALGGGGKAMHVVHDDGELDEAFESARRLAASAFGDATLYIEKRLERPRHIEVQVAGDGKGHAIHCFERECSLQRRHQKVLEECPAPWLSEAQRQALTEAAVALAESICYRGVGTVEFLLMPGGSFYFLEMNTRLQVEHPVTEWVTGLDLVRVQLLIAAEGRLPLEQADVPHRGHALEARVYAEDASRGFVPQAGQAVKVRWPTAPFVRVDAGIESGDRVPLHYDPILGKVTAFGDDRDQALRRLAAALDHSVIHGVISNLPFLRALVRAPEVAHASFDTEWIERDFLGGFAALAGAPVPDLALAAVSIAEFAPAAVGAASARRPSLPGSQAFEAGFDPFRSAGRWRLPGLS